MHPLRDQRIGGSRMLRHTGSVDIATAVATVEVIADAGIVTAVASVGDTLDCLTTSVTLSAAGSVMLCAV